MHSRSPLRQLALLHSLQNAREKRAHAARKRAISRGESLAQQLRETEAALVNLEEERLALFARHGGLIKRGDLFQIKRRESLLESRRIELMLVRSEIETARIEAEAAARQAFDAVVRAQHKCKKVAHVRTLYRNRFLQQEHIQEDNEVEEAHCDD